MSDAPPSERLSEADPEEPEPDNLNCITTAMIYESKMWNILVYGINDSDQISNHHMDLLCGILGEQISYEKRSVSSFHFEKNGVTVTVHMGIHNDCNVTSDEVDLLLYFMPVKPDRSTDHSMISDISRKHGAMIWKHSVAILTGTDTEVDEFIRTPGSWTTKFDVFLGILTRQIQGSLEESINEIQDVAKEDLLILPAGRHDRPDLPKPHEKWLSLLWNGCFLQSKVTSMPAIIKLAQDRVSYNVKISDLQRHFYHQPIQTKEKGLSQKVKLGLIAGGGGSTAVGAVAGATVGALTGALAFGIPTFGIAAKTGLAIGLVVGAGVGAGAVSVVAQAIKNKKTGNASSRGEELKIQYAELVTNLPSVMVGLRKVAKGRVTCRIVVTGIEGEGFSEVAAALAGKRVINGTESYWRQVIPRKANLVIYDVPGFPKNSVKLPRARKLKAIQASRDTHLLVFCIPMTYREKKFFFSPHAASLRDLSIIDKSILSNTVIALTNAHNLGEEANFQAELEKWKTEIRELLRESDSIDLEEELIQKIPILPVGDKNGVIEIPANEQPEQYYWLTELLLHAMPVTKPSGLPTLIKWNKMVLINDADEDEPPNEVEAPPIQEQLEEPEIEEQPQQQQPPRPVAEPFDLEQQLKFQDVNNARELIIEAQCNMFSKMGLQNFEPYYGKEIGMILGENDNQDW